MIEFKKVYFSYKNSNSSIKDISFSIKQGECVILCGKSGSGKSTILRIVSGLAPVFYDGILQGNIKVNGQIPAELESEERAELFGVVFQDPRSQFFMNTVQDEICFAAENIGVSSNKIKEMLYEVSEFIGIEDLLLRNIDELSSGQKQKVAIASSLILQPKVLILDEPTSNLDIQGSKVLIEIIKKIKDKGISVVISEHRLDSFKEVADRFLYINKGKLDEIWTRKEFENLSDKKLLSIGLRPKTVEKNTNNYIENDKEPLLDIQSLSFRYKKTNSGIDNINLKLYKGEVVSLLGNNGAGKTTLCRVISGLLREKKGTIKYKGKISNCNLRNKFCYFVMQDADYQLYSDSVSGEIVFGKKVTEKLKEKYELYYDEDEYLEVYLSKKYPKFALVLEVADYVNYMNYKERICGYTFDDQDSFDHFHKDRVENPLECKNFEDIFYSLDRKETIDVDIEKREIIGELNNYKFIFDLITRDIKSIQNMETGEFLTISM